MRGTSSAATRVSAGALLLWSLWAQGCASPRQAAGVGLVVVGSVAAAAGLAASGVIQETPDPRLPVSARNCIDRCAAGSDSPVDALLTAGGAAAVMAGEALLATDPGSKAPPPAPAAPGGSVQPALQGGGATPTGATAVGAVPGMPAVAAEPPAHSPTHCLGPLQDPAAIGCAQ